jgi:hypothetical protein
VTKQDAIWVAIRVIGMYLLVQAVAELPTVLKLPPIARVVLWAGLGVYLVRGGKALFELACSEPRAAAP